MRKIIFSLTILSLFLPLLHAEVKVSSASGDVTVLHNGAWSKAAPGSSLELKDRVKTGDSGRAVLTMDGATRVWLKKNSDMEITNTGESSLFSLLAGKIRAMVKLKTGSKFSVKTPVSVASVRGTEFVADTQGLLAVIEGKVNFSDVDMKKSIDVLAGFVSQMGVSGEAAPPREITPAEKQALEGEWGDFGSMEQGSKNSGEQKKDFVQLRNELRQAVNDIKNDVNTAREISNGIKEADIATGRTLRDVNGNLVRVEQYLLRPDQNTFEVLNLTKRTDYTYVNHTGNTSFGFSDIPNKSRLDIADVKITMNMGLPEQLTEWPSFISAKGDALHPQGIDISLTNQVDVMEMKGTWGLKGVDHDEKGVLLTNDRIVMKPYINGWAVDTTYNLGGQGQSFPADNSNATQLYEWNISPLQKITKDGQTKYVYIYNEAYGINNDGKILSLNDFTSSSDNPFIALKSVAAESIVFVRNNDSSKSNFLSTAGPGNLDLVTTPDMVISIAQKLASQIGDLTKK